jgi:5-methylcytosine-specific restriction endonuclease McrA
MTKGEYKHKPQQGFQKGNTLGSLTKGKIPWIKGKHHTEEAKQIMRLKKLGCKHTPEHIEKRASKMRGIPRPEANVKRGSEHYCWKGGIARISKSIRSGMKYYSWRDKVLERDNYTCQNCGKFGGKLHCHHKVEFAKNKDLRYDVSNGITLCLDCHYKLHYQKD